MNIVGASDYTFFYVYIDFFIRFLTSNERKGRKKENKKKKEKKTASG